MKKVKCIAMSLAASLFVGLFTSYAISFDDKKLASSGNASVEPACLSSLSNEVLGKFTDDAKNELSKIEFGEKVNRLTIEFNRNIEAIEAEKIIEAQLSDKIDCIEKAQDELASTMAQNEAYSVERSSFNNSSIAEKEHNLDVAITECNLARRTLIDEVYEEYNKPIIDGFISRNFSGNEDNYEISYPLCCIYDFSASVDDVIKFAEDEAVGVIHISPINTAESVSADEIVGNIGASEVNSSSSVPNGLDVNKVNQIYNMLGGNTAVSQGYRGSGVVVGMVETGVPDQNIVSDVTYFRSKASEVSNHATINAYIIKKMAPSCSIIAAATAPYSTTSVLIKLIENNRNINVINVSRGHESDGKYGYDTSIVDKLSETYRIPIVISAGNGSEKFVSSEALAPNAIAVGAVNHRSGSGTYDVRDSVSSYYQYNGSQKDNKKSMVNKPDVCAPGDVKTNDTDAYTSFAAPFVTGTAVQMMSVNSNFKNQTRMFQHIIKASLMASCFSNAGTSRNIPNTISSDFEGAGVISAAHCYKIAANKSYNYYSITTLGTTKAQIEITDVTKPVRIAIAWKADTISNNKSFSSHDEDCFDNTNIMLNVVKKGETRRVASSSGLGYLYNSIETLNGPVVNYQYVEISAATLAQKGAGVYEISIVANQTQSSTISVPIGLAFCQK